MDFINLISLHVEKEHVGKSQPNNQDAINASPSGSGRRLGQRLQQCSGSDGCYVGGTGAIPAPGLKVLVVRPRLPSGCSPTNALVGGCDIPVSSDDDAVKCI